MRHFDFCVRAVCFALTSVLGLCVAATPALADTIVLSWDPNPELSVTGYTLYVGTQSGSYTQRIDVEMTTSYAWPGATAGQRYCFALSAYTAEYLEGPKSREVCGYSNQYPILTNPGGRSSTLGHATNLQLQGSDPDGQPVSYTATGLPPGLSLMSSTGYISGTPTASGSYSVTASVFDGVLRTSQTFTWTITDTAISGPSSGDSSSTGNGTGLRGDYYSGRAFDSLITTRTEAVDFDWGWDSPAWNVPADNFSVRWTGELLAPATGTYYFYTVSDDGVRLWVGDQLLINEWSDHGGKTDIGGGVWLQAGQRYPIKVEYYEGTGRAVMQLQWTYPGQSPHVIPVDMLLSSGATSGGSGSSGGGDSGSGGSGSGGSGSGGSDNGGTWAPLTGGGLTGKYFDGLFLTYLTTRVEAVNFVWGYDAPAPNVPADNFAVQWTGQLIAPVSGTYTFATVSDDGVALWVNNQWLISNWTNHGATTDMSPGIYLEAGQRYPLRLDYYESGGGAVIQLLWAVPGRGFEVIPQNALTQ